MGILNQRYLALKALIDKAPTPANHNRYVNPINRIVDQLEAQERLRDKQSRQMSLVPDHEDEYEAALKDSADKLEATAAVYEALAADPKVKAALKAVDAEGGGLRLGPSPAFERELAAVRKVFGAAKAGVIRFEPGLGVALVDVTINGTFIEPMIVDSGASIISLSPGAAKELGLTPGPNDQKITLTLADGREVEGVVMTLKSVTLGQYTVENVECVVQTGAADETESLLGNTFLQHFVYRMDVAAGKLHMTPAPGALVKTAAPVAPQTFP